MHELDVIELIHPVDGHPAGTAAAVVSLYADGTALAEIVTDDGYGSEFIDVTAADVRITHPAPVKA